MSTSSQKSHLLGIILNVKIYIKIHVSNLNIHRGGGEEPKHFLW